MLFLRDILLLQHLAQHIIAPLQMLVRILFRVIPSRAAGNRGKACTLRQGQLAGMATKNFQRGSFDPGSIIGKANRIEVGSQNGLFIVFCIQLIGPVNLLHLTQITHNAARFVITGQVFDELLVNGGSALLYSARVPTRHGVHCLIKIANSVRFKLTPLWS